jgi:hypothetical protein
MSKMQMNETRVRQHEHHAAQYATYHNELHAEINQAKRLVKHLMKRPGDECALAALMALPEEALKQVPHAMDFAEGRMDAAH